MVNKKCSGRTWFKKAYLLFLKSSIIWFRKDLCSKSKNLTIFRCQNLASKIQNAVWVCDFVDRRSDRYVHNIIYLSSFWNDILLVIKESDFRTFWLIQFWRNESFSVETRNSKDARIKMQIFFWLFTIRDVSESNTVFENQHQNSNNLFLN